ncbi:MAG: PAS domain S-box protein [SAR324 cluster bacterium]|nr:PAS domain S-box protein [SAR324 cluster bacterium]
MVSNRLSRILVTPLWDYNSVELEEFVTAEMENRNIYAILVKDLLNDSIAIGKKRDNDWNPVALDAEPNSDWIQIEKSTPILRKEQTLGSVSIYMTEHFINQKLTEDIGLFIFQMLFLTFLEILTLSFALHVGITRPLGRLRDIFLAVERGDLNQKIDLRRNDELGMLAKGFAYMRDSIRDKILQLQESEERFRSFSEQTLIGICVVQNDRIVYANQSFANIVGYTIKELKFFSSKDVYRKLTHPDDLKKVEEQSVKKQTGSKDQIIPQYEWRMLNKSGDWHWVESYSSTIIYEGKTANLLYVTDITNRKQAEEDRMKLETAIEQAAETIAITDVNGVIEYVNPSFEKTSGYSSEEAIGKTHNILNSGKQSAEFYKQQWDVILSGKVWKNQIINKKKNGELYTESITISPVIDQKGVITHFISHKRDITQELDLENQLRQSQKLESMGILAGGIAHEFNNLLSPILGYTEMLLEEQSEKMLDYSPLQEISNAGQRAKALVQQILTFSRKSASERKPVQLAEIVEEAMQFLLHTLPSSISISTDIDPNLPEIFASPHEIHQVLLNLCINASHAMPKNGALKIELKNKGFCQLRNMEGKIISNHFVCLSIEDNGIGIDQGTLEHIFDPFFTTKDVGEGTGLGLSVVLGIVDQHGGVIEVFSEIGKGTTFQVYLPISQEENTDVSDTASLEILRGKESILLVDDEPIVQKMVKVMLDKMGYQVFSFTDCYEMLASFEKSPQDFDLILTDYTMPKMTGVQLAKQIKQIRSDIPIVIMTGFNQEVSEENIPNFGIDGFLMKPFQKEEISQLLRKMLDNRKI